MPQGARPAQLDRRDAARRMIVFASGECAGQLRLFDLETSVTYADIDYVVVEGRVVAYE